MFRLFYQPSGTWFGDCMPFYENGQFHLFHQRDTRNPGVFGEPFGWSLARTSNFIDYEDLGEVIPGGGDDAQDQFIYAGSVFRGADAYYAFYTGYNRTFADQGRPAQALMIATSTDLLHWTKTDRAVVLPEPGYDPNHWRDPFLFFDRGRQRYVLILGARKIQGQKVLTGRTVYFTSSDLQEWEFRGDFWAPDLYTMHEMPDLFQLGDYWYLLTTDYNDACKTVYRMSRSLEGPWAAPPDDAFDGRAYYAARSAADGEHRYLFGWVPTKENDDDTGAWQWGGTLLVHELVQRADGTLGVALPGTVRAALINSTPLQEGPIQLSRADGLAETVLSPQLEPEVSVTATIRFSAGTRKISLRLRENPETGEGYQFSLHPSCHQVRFDRHGTFRWSGYNDKGLQRFVHLEPDTDHRLQLICDGTIATLYVDNVALSARMYTDGGAALAVDVVDGAVEIRDAVVSQVAPRNQE